MKNLSMDFVPLIQICGANLKSRIAWESYHHKNSLPVDVVEAMRPVFRDLANPELLKKCLHGGTQNPNESVNNVIWSRVPKKTFVQLEVLSLDLDTTRRKHLQNFTKPTETVFYQGPRFFWWFKAFSEGRESIEDEPRSERPSVSKTAENVVRVRDVVRSDRRLTKNHLKGHHFWTLENIQTAVTDQLEAVPISEFHQCYEEWKKRLQRCVALEGSYIEGDNVELCGVDVENASSGVVFIRIDHGSKLRSPCVEQCNLEYLTSNCKRDFHPAANETGNTLIFTLQLIGNSSVSQKRVKFGKTRRINHRQLLPQSCAIASRPAALSMMVFDSC
ncbi:uncharacterized protein TNCV_3144911 [Trichonephila clavipes]|nr:uncharacterized protein TNCV_3144911 [Trichonephila clavipes]